MSVDTQAVILTLADGRKLAYVGPVQIGPDDADVRVVDIAFHPHPSLPGVDWQGVATRPPRKPSRPASVPHAKRRRKNDAENNFLTE